MRFKTIFAVAVLAVLGILIMTVSCTRKASNSAQTTSSSKVSSSSDINSIGKYAKIKPTDSEDVKRRKERYNELVKEAEKLNNEYQEKFRSGTLTSEEDAEYRRKGEELKEKRDALGIDPEADLTADERFRKDIDGYITVCEIAEEMYLDDDGNVKPEYKYEYERACRKTRYLKKVKEDYEAGKITAEEALKAFDEFNNIK